MLKTLFGFAILLLFNGLILGQNRDEQLGSGSNVFKQGVAGSVFDYSDPESVNIKVFYIFQSFPQ